MNDLRIKIIDNIESIRWVEVLNLIHESFADYKDENILFTCSNYTLGDLINKVLRGHYFIAEDVSGKLVGITSISAIKPAYAYENITAISPSCKGKGIGSLLISIRKKFCLSHGIKYIISDTSVKAIPSVEWHLKRCSCYKYGYKSFASTNYFSYEFVECIEKCSIIKRVLFYLRFLMFFCLTYLCKNEDGTWTFLGRMYNVFNRKIRK